MIAEDGLMTTTLTTPLAQETVETHTFLSLQNLEPDRRRLKQSWEVWRSPLIPYPPQALTLK